MNLADLAGGVVDLALGVCVAMGVVADSVEVDCAEVDSVVAFGAGVESSFASLVSEAFGAAGVFCLFLGVFL